VSALPVLLGACGSEERELALARIDDARRELASLAPQAFTGLAHDSVRLARDGLLDAESIVRRDRVWPFESPAWELQLERALDNARIASWFGEIPNPVLTILFLGIAGAVIVHDVRTRGRPHWATICGVLLVLGLTLGFRLAGVGDAIVAGRLGGG